MSSTNFENLNTIMRTFCCSITVSKKSVNCEIPHDESSLTNKQRKYLLDKGNKLPVTVQNTKCLPFILSVQYCYRNIVQNFISNHAENGEKI